MAFTIPWDDWDYENTRSFYVGAMYLGSSDLEFCACGVLNYCEKR